jgi:hypothetical protein
MTNQKKGAHMIRVRNYPTDMNSYNPIEKYKHRKTSVQPKKEPIPIQKSISEIIVFVAKKEEISGKMLLSKRRFRKNVEARQICFMRLREVTKLTLTEIGSYFNCDHATVLHGIKQVENIKELRDRYDYYFHGGKEPIKPYIKSLKDLVIKKPEAKAQKVKPIEDIPIEPIERLQRFVSPYANVPASGGYFTGYRPHM